MQPRVTIQALATVWLAVVGLGAAVTHRLSHDQYFPASPHRHSRVQRNQIRDWRDHDPAEDQPLDLWIGSRRSIPAEEPPALPHSSTKFTEQNFPLERSSKEDIVSSKRDYPFSAWQKWLLNIAGAEFEADKVDYGYEMPQTLLRETVILPSDLLDDPFVADDTFQDQGPGSVEIYKLDLSKENVLLTATTPTNDLLPKNKSKSPKKTNHLNSKTKTTEIKLTTTPSTKTHHEQSNVYEERRTETPSVNTNSFGVGGVPELQVGCEGLEASSSSSSSHKTKRSIDTPDKEQRQVPASILKDATSLIYSFLDYDTAMYDDEEEEIEDELLKLRRLEATKKTNRGDIDALMDADYLSPKEPDRLPVRGDLGESAFVHSNKSRIKRDESLGKIEIKNQEEIKEKRMPISSDEVDGAGKNRGRRLLWLAEANTEGFAYDKSEQKRAKRSIDWGFGEDEGVVSSNELQTMNARRRKHDMRYHQDRDQVARKRDQYYEVNSDINKIRQEYEEHLAQKRRAEEEQRLRQQQHNDRRTPNRWMEEEEGRRDKMRTRQYDEYFRKMNHIPASRTEDDETRRRQMEERQRDEEERRRRLHEDEKMRRRSQSKWQEENVKRPNLRTPVYDEEKIQRSNDEMRRREEEARRQEWYRKQQETQRRKDEEERKRSQEENRLREQQLRELAERRRQEEAERRRQEEAERRRREEEERRRQQQPPSNLMDTRSQSRHPNDIERRDRDEERRMREDEERQREKKLREYIARNQPINVNHPDRKSEEERRRYRPEYNRDSQMSTNRNVEEYRRQMEEQRRRQEEEQRRRQEGEQRRRQEEEEKKLQDYIKRNQPINVRNNQLTSSRDLLEERRLIEQARRRDRYSEAGRHRGPSVSTYIDPRSSPEEIWRRQQETARRQEEERRREREREEKERRLREEQMRKEAARREQEARREQSRRYEEERKRLEAARLREERRRQEMLRERSRSEAERTRQPEAARLTYYQDPRLMEHRRRQDSQPIPGNLVRNEQERRKERQRLEQEAERRRQQENKWREHGRNESEYGRSRQELTRLNSLPISARIIVHPITPSSPTVLSRVGGNEVDFTGINPHRQGVQVAKFPVAPTSRPPVPSPKPCVWAVVHCCSSNNSRLSKCFESLGCPGINWDPNPCSSSIVEAARAEIMKFYESQ